MNRQVAYRLRLENVMVALGNTYWNSGEQQPEILLVEDEEISRRALALLLHAKGFKTNCVGSGEEAMLLLNKGIHPGLALVDLDLPGMNGLKLIELLAHSHPAIPAVLITASSRERLEQLLPNHNIPYMRKPLDFGLLLALLPSTASQS